MTSTHGRAAHRGRAPHQQPVLHIGIVAYEMEGAATGVGRYLEGLLGGLRAPGRSDGPDLRLSLLFKGDPFEHPLWSSPTPPATAGTTPTTTIEPRFDGRPNARPIGWEQLRLPSLLQPLDCDLIFSPSYSLPPRLPAPAIVTIHDLSFEHLPKAFPRRERWRRRFLARRAAQRAARVLADTERIAAELVGMYRLAPERVSVVPLAVDRRFSALSDNTDPQALAALGLTKPYVLVLGTVLDRRRLDVTLAAFDQLAATDPDLRLVIAGNNRLRQPGDLERWIAATAARDRVQRLGWVDESQLPALYRQAAAAVYLSTYEGYGLPPLEALACGTPCVVSEGLGLDDLWPDYPLRAIDIEPDAVAALVRRALGPTGTEVGHDGAARMLRLDWQHTAVDFLNVVHAVLGDRGSSGAGDATASTRLAEEST